MPQPETTLTPNTWYHRNKEARQKYVIDNRERYTIAQRGHRVSLRTKAMEVLGGAFCKRCGFDDIRALQIDHIHGGGYKEHQAIGADAIKRKIINNPEQAVKDYQVLCANCNWIKKSENNENTPRKTEYAKS